MIGLTGSILCKWSVLFKWFDPMLHWFSVDLFWETRRFIRLDRLVKLWILGQFIIDLLLTIKLRISSFWNYNPALSSSHYSLFCLTISGWLRFQLGFFQWTSHWLIRIWRLHHQILLMSGTKSYFPMVKTKSFQTNPWPINKGWLCHGNFIAE